MTSLDKAVRLSYEFKARGRVIINAAHEQGAIHIQLRQELREQVYDQLPASPHWLRTQVRDYLEGYEDAVVRANTSHLYEIDGQHYAISSTPKWAVGEDGKPLPSWASLPREKWPLGGGGIYWIYRGSGPALFFKSEEEVK